MQALTWLTSVLAPGTTIMTQVPSAPQPTTATLPAQPVDAMYRLPLEMQPPGQMAQMMERGLRQRAVANGKSFATRWNKCLDVKDGKFANAAPLQIWDCHQGSNNQQWALSGNLLRADNSMCLDLPMGAAYNSAPLQLWACNDGNRNQWWEMAGGSLRKQGTNFCVDVLDGRYDNGGRLQLWNCDYRAEGNQRWAFGGVAQQSTQSASSFLGYSAISIERFSQLHPECAPWQGHFIAAAAGTGLVPVLLGAIAETESTCQERPKNGWGLAQFSDDSAWRAYGGGGDRQKASDAIWGMARYIRQLLNENNQNLDSALRAYNGPLSQGGNPNYHAEIRSWMSGGNPWG